MEATFGAALDAIRQGDATSLARILDTEPRLLHERTIDTGGTLPDPEFAYFENPKLFWYLANNPILVERMPENLVEIAETMIARGVERDDLDVTLGLTVSGCALREQGLARPLMSVLLDAGAVAARDAIETAAGHRELDALAMLVERGLPMDAGIAASLGDMTALRSCLASSSPREVQTAFDLAAINGHLEAMKLLLGAGADASAYLTVHSHSTALHQAGDRDDVPAIRLLLASGARRDIRDTRWDGTPLDWARYLGRTAAQSALQ